MQKRCKSEFILQLINSDPNFDMGICDYATDMNGLEVVLFLVDFP